MLKKAIIITAIWTALVHFQPPGSRRSSRGPCGAIGAGIGTLTTVGYACIWLPYAAKVGKERRAEREKAERKRKRRR